MYSLLTESVFSSNNYKRHFQAAAKVHPTPTYRTILTMFTPNLIPLIKRPLYKFLATKVVWYRNIRYPQTFVRFSKPAMNGSIVSGSLSNATLPYRSLRSHHTGHHTNFLTARLFESTKVHNLSSNFLSTLAVAAISKKEPFIFATYVTPDVLVFNLNNVRSGAACQAWIVNVLTGNQVSEDKAVEMASRWLGQGSELVGSDYQTLLAVFGDEYVSAVINRARAEFID